MRIIWILMIFSLFIAAATAITCYDCNSLSDPRCGEFFFAEGVKQTNCDEAEMPEHLQNFEERVPATGCTTKIYTGIKQRYYIRRECFFGYDEKEACKQKDRYVPWADLLDCQVCKEELCNINSARKSALSKMFLCITIVLSLILNKIM